MRRWIVASGAALALIAGGALAGAEVLYPKQSAYLAFEPPPGWTVTENTGSIQMSATDQSGAIILSLAHNAPLNGQPAQTIALAIGKPLNVTQFTRQEPAKLSGKDGTAFYVSTTSQNQPLDIQIVVFQIAADLLVTETILSSKLTPAQERSLGRALGSIRLVNGP